MNILFGLIIGSFLVILTQKITGSKISILIFIIGFCIGLTI